MSAAAAAGSNTGILITASVFAWSLEYDWLVKTEWRLDPDAHKPETLPHSAAVQRQTQQDGASESRLPSCRGPCHECVNVMQRTAPPLALSESSSATASSRLSQLLLLSFLSAVRRCMDCTAQGPLPLNSDARPPCSSRQLPEKGKALLENRQTQAFPGFWPLCCSTIARESLGCKICSCVPLGDSFANFSLSHGLKT